MPHFVYIAKNDASVQNKPSDFEVNTKGRGKKTPTGAVGIHGGFIIDHLAECDQLKIVLMRNENKDIVDALINLIAACDKKQVILKQNVVFMIHFGNQNTDTCRAFTKLMNDIADKDDNLSMHRFIAVSQYNNFPEGFFLDGRLLPPDTVTINAVLVQGIEDVSEISVYDHLRGLVLLCQALQNMSKEKREEKFFWSPGVEWWRSCLWGNEMPRDMEHAFSTAEIQILEKNELLHDFCSSFFDNPFILKKFDNNDILQKIVATITEALNNE